jgi:glycosyltransferase involved in cell wall biosynthesis
VTSPVSEPLVSVVTPFHNTGAYLSECIESVLSQSYDNFEYLLVDNQSTDRGRQIAEGYARKDARIRLMRSDRLRPQVPNYNFSLAQIHPSSVYTKVVQADDWLFPRCLTEMVELAEAHPSVAMVSSYHLVETELRGAGLKPSQKVISGRDACRRFLLGDTFLFGSPTTVLYRSEIVRARQPFYREGLLHEDTEAAYEILADHDFGFVHQVLSFSRLDNVSMTGSVLSYLPDRLDRLICIKRFGEIYLTPRELRASLEDTLKWYYDGLAMQWIHERLHKRDPRFWEYQRTGLTSVGERVHPGRMARRIAAVLLRNAIPPPLRSAKQAVSLLRDRIGRLPPA